MTSPDLPTVREPGFVDRVLAVVADLRRLALDHLELATVEAQQAAVAMVAVIAAAFGVGVLAFTAWIALVGLAIIAWTQAGHGWASGLALAIVVHLVAAAGLVLWIRARLPRIAFPATVRQLRESMGGGA